MQLSEHFSLEELTASRAAARNGLDNSPPPEVLTDLTLLASETLEQARAIVGCPIIIDSGYRSPAVNAIDKGAEHSAHLYGRAADCRFVGVPLKVAFDRLRTSTLSYDQLIIECGEWCHVARAAAGEVPRREALVGSWDAVNEKWVYSPVDDG